MTGLRYKMFFVGTFSLDASGAAFPGMFMQSVCSRCSEMKLS